MARFNVGVLAGLIGRVLPTLGEENEEAGLALGCALLRLRPARVLLVATDRYRMARAEMRSRTPSPEDREVLLPRRLLRTLLTLFPLMGDAPVDFGITDNAIYYRGGNYLLGSRRVAGRFPSFESVIPSCQQQVVAPRLGLLAAIERLKGFDDSQTGLILFDLRVSTLVLRAQALGAYESVEQLEVEWLGEDAHFCLRAQCLMSCLPQLRGAKDVILGIPERRPNERKRNLPVALTAKDGDPYNALYLLMPTANSRSTEERKHNSAAS